jgi:beta-galactosidase
MDRQSSRAPRWVWVLAAIGSTLGSGALPAVVFARDGARAAQVAPPSASPRASIGLEHGWRFKQSDSLNGVEQPGFDDSGWTVVAVPHTWNRLGNAGIERSAASNTVQGVGWYRLRFEVPAAGAGATRYFLEFDGVGAVADVWLNGRYLGKHSGAFSRFRFDATAALDSAGENLLVVKADNSKPQPGSSTAAVVPLSGDFFVFGGIYRNVSLVVTGPVHIDMLDYGGPGVYARAASIEAEGATVEISSRLVDDTAAAAAVRLEASIEDAKGSIVAAASKAVTVVPAAESAARAGTTVDPSSAGITTHSGRITSASFSLHIPHPRLWRGTQEPYLYRTILSVHAPSGALLDRVVQPLGLRTVAFDPDKGFFLNGEHVFLHGVSMHQDRPVKGWAISGADQEQDFQILTDLGGNVVRLAHYQHDQRSYELADALGIVAWAEIPLVNQVSFDGKPASPELVANATQQLQELIRQNYNHPSIALWSIGNEVDLRATQANGPSQARPLLESLNRLAKSEDPDRVTTLADCCEVGLTHNKSAAATQREVIVGVTDAVGYNRYFGWYGGTFTDFGPMLDAAHARHPRVPLAVSEYGAGAALTQHSDDPGGGPINSHGRPHPEEFQDLYHEAAWSTLKKRNYLWGVFVWNLFDFSSDSRKEGDLTDVNDKGLVSYDRALRKDAFYFYRANWSAQPTLHLVGRRYTDRVYAVVDVKAYSNATRAELSLNGAPQGGVPCSDGVCLWHSVHLTSGSNELRATARIAGATVTDAMRWEYAGSPAIVRIKAGDISGYVTPGNERYGSDMYFEGGEGKVTVAGAGDQQPTIAAADPPLYSSFREGSFAYRIPVPAGRYKIVARFVEPTATSAGSRVFDVKINGKVAARDFDIYAAAGGKLTGIERIFAGTASNGTLLIELRPARGQAVLSSLAIAPLPH